MDDTKNGENMEKSAERSTIGKVGIRRHVVIPKQICDQLGIKEGDFVEILSENGTVILKPKKLVDSQSVVNSRHSDDRV